jgi:hypothetical protein
MAVVSNGTTIIDAGALGSGVPAGKMILIKTLTASSSATLSFVDGAASVVLDATYDSYVFKFINVHQATDVATLSFQVSTDGGSSYGVNITSTFFYATLGEGGASAGVHYWTARDLAQSTSFQMLGEDAGNDSDQCYGGELKFFSPSSDTFVKHFMSQVQSTQRTDYSVRAMTAGYVNTTSAVNAVQFKMTSGNIDSGVIKLYGIGG